MTKHPASSIQYQESVSIPVNPVQLNWLLVFPSVSSVFSVAPKIRTTIFQLLVFCARFLLWLIVMSLFTRIYETFLQKELFGCGRGRSPRLRRVLRGLKNVCAFCAFSWLYFFALEFFLFLFLLTFVWKSVKIPACLLIGKRKPPAGARFSGEPHE